MKDENKLFYYKVFQDILLINKVVYIINNRLFQAVTIVVQELFAEKNLF